LFACFCFDKGGRRKTLKSRAEFLAVCDSGKTKIGVQGLLRRELLGNNPGCLLRAGEDCASEVVTERT
jgi:hypothetical protein